jgi:hypothetical protein
MKTTDLFKNTRSAKKLNEGLEKTFGKRLNLESFDLPKLEDARNKLRTQIHDARSQSGFNENIENEAMTQAQWMLDAINAEIAEREEFTADAGVAEVEEGFGSLEEKVQELLQRFERDAMEIGGYGDPDIKEIVKHLENGDAESAAEVVWYAYTDQDGGEFPEKEPLIDDLQAEFEELAQGGDEDQGGDEGGETDDNYAMASAGFGSDEDYESIQYEDQVTEKAVSQAQQQAAGIALAAKRKGETPSGKGAAAEMAKMSMKELEKFAGTKHKNLPAKKDESVETGDNMTKLQEGEIQQASAIVTAKTMVDRVGRWIEELSGMENDTLLQLGDSIRDEMGQEQAKTFISSVAPAIQQALENLKATREALSTGVRTLTGEEQPANMLGAEPGAEASGMDDLEAPAEPDAMNAEPEGDIGDEFAAAEPAAGGLGDAGRAQRESIDRSNNLLRVLAG